LGYIAGLPSVVFVDIHVEGAHLSKRSEKLKEVLTRRGRISVYTTDIQNFIILYECPKSQTEVDICAHIFQARNQKFISFIPLVFHLLDITIFLLFMVSC
jgi:hypothetical protein